MARGAAGVKTQMLLREMKKAARMLKFLRYWVKKVYENDQASLKLFQLSKYWKVRNRQAELIAYLSALATTVAEQRSKLEVANVPADLLDSVADIAKSLKEANIAQENSKAERQADTQNRVDRLNDIYSVCVAFSNAAEFVFEENPAKRELYRVPGNSRSGTKGKGSDDE